MYLKGMDVIWGSIVAIVLLWFTSMIIVYFIKIALLKSLRLVTEGEGQDVDTDKKVLLKKNRICVYSKLLHIALTLLAIIAIMFFVFFMNTPNAEQKKNIQTIHQAPLPQNFHSPSQEEIKKSNQKSIAGSLEKVKVNAQDANAKAMNDSIKLFKNTKGEK